MAIDKTRLRQLHAALAPFMTFPLLLTLVTGMSFQMAVMSEKGNEFLWLLELHRGKFGNINLENIYPFLNGLGLLTVIITGILLWFQIRERPTSRS